MTNSTLRKLVAIFVTIGFLLLPLKPSYAFLDEYFGSLTIEKERQIGEEFLLEIQQEVNLVEDPYLTSYLNRLGQKVVSQLSSQPFHFQFFIIDDPTMNAFAVPGGYIFVHVGLIRMCEREGELAGVIAHEISHVYLRHMAQMVEKAKVVNIATLIGAMASIFLGGAVAAPLMMGSMAAGQSAMLAYSRDFEAEADAHGFRWMVKSGYNPRNMVSIFNKMLKQRWFEGGKVPVYLATHPGMESRIVELSHQLAVHKDELPPETDNPDFHYFTTRLEADVGNPNQLLRRMTQDAIREPNNPLCYYGKALALAKLEHHQEAVQAFQQALALSPGNFLIQRDLAVFYFDHNRYPEAEKLLKELSKRAPQDDVVLYYLGRIHQERKQNDQALPLFEKVHKLNSTFSEVYYNLGILYGEKGQLGLAHYYLGFHSLRSKDLRTALFHFRKALTSLPINDSHYIEVKNEVARLGKMKVRPLD